MCDRTPRQQVVLPLDETSPSVARTWLHAVTCVDHGAGVLDDATLLVSELVTNAVKHGGPPLVLAVDCDGSGLRVRVRDGNPALPVPRRAGVDEEDGRGFLLLDLLSEQWGVEPEVEVPAEVGGPLGKEVWFLLGERPTG